MQLSRESPAGELLQYLRLSELSLQELQGLCVTLLAVLQVSQLLLHLPLQHKQMTSKGSFGTDETPQLRNKECGQESQDRMKSQGTSGGARGKWVSFLVGAHAGYAQPSSGLLTQGARLGGGWLRLLSKTMQVYTDPQNWSTHTHLG